MTAPKILVYGKATDAINTEIRMGKTTVLNTMLQFACTVVKVFGPEYLREPTVEDKNMLAIGGARRFLGMLD